MTDSASELSCFLARAERLLDRIDTLLPAGHSVPDWKAAVAFRWRKGANGSGWLQPVVRPHPIRLADLRHRRPESPRRRQHRASSSPASRPTTCCSPARAAAAVVAGQGAAQRVRKEGVAPDRGRQSDLVDLPDIVDLVAERPERFMIFCDDLSFEAGDASYRR